MSSDNTTTTSQQATTNPFGPTIPGLTSLAGTVANTPTATTAAQQNAANTLMLESGQIPGITPTETGAVQNSLTASTSPWQGMLGEAVGNFQNAQNNYDTNTNPIAQNTDFNPYDTPGFSSMIQAINAPIAQQVESQFAGSGRDPTGSGGGFAKAEATGEAIPDTQAALSQYNTNEQNFLNANQGQAGVAATGSGIESGASTAGSGEELSALQQQLAGLSGAGYLPSLATAPGTAEVAAANNAFGLPWQNLSPALAASEGLGGVGGTSSGTGTTTQQTSPLTNILGLLTGGAGIAGAIAKSDSREKENIDKIGEKKGHNIYRFNFKSDPTNTPHTGVLAQEAEKVQPGAVHTHKGTKYVDYGKLGLLGMDRDAA
jgi:hypothetical protein